MLLAVLHTKPGNSASDQPCLYPEPGSYVQIAFISDPTSTSMSQHPIGRDTTFEKDVDDEELIFQVLDGLSEEVHEDVIANGFKFKTIIVRVRYQHFDTYTRSKSLLFATDDLDILKNSAKRLTAPFLRGKKKIRLIGVRVSNLISLSKSPYFYIGSRAVNDKEEG